MATYWVDCGYGGRAPCNSIEKARKLAIMCLEEPDYSKRPTAKAMSMIRVTDNRPKVRIFATETGDKEVGFVHVPYGRNSYYYVTYNPAWGVADFALKADGKLVR